MISIYRSYINVPLISKMLMKADKYEETIKNLHSMFDDVEHDLLVKRHISWCCPNDEMISAIVDKIIYNKLPLVSIECGRGVIELLVYLKLKTLGIDGKGLIYASDLKIYETHINKDAFYPHIIRKDALEAVSEANLNLNDQYMLLVSWPSCDEKWATDAVKASKATYVGYVGESILGMTGDNELNNLLCRGYEQDTPYETVCTVKIPTSPEVRDFFTICREKTTSW